MVNPPLVYAQFNYLQLPSLSGAKLAAFVLRKALATTGSNWVPMHRLISCRAAATDIAGR